MNPPLKSRSKSFIRPPVTKSDEKAPNDRRTGLRSGLRSCKSSQSSPTKCGFGSNVQANLVVKAEPVTTAHSPSNGQLNGEVPKLAIVTQVPKLAIVKPAQRSWIDTDYSR